jgi:hypothetical protein
MSNGELAGTQKAPAVSEQAAALAPSPEASAEITEALSEDRTLGLLKQPGLAPDVIEQIARNGELLKYRKVKLAVVQHPRTPRHLSLPLIRQLYTFDLMQVSLTPTTPADLKRVADEALCMRMETISSGERLSLAHRASGLVAGALLMDAEARVVQAALENPRLTESLVIKAVVSPKIPAHSIAAICHHLQWASRREVRIALLRSDKTPMAKAVDFAHGLPPTLLREILHNSRLPQQIKTYLLQGLAQTPPERRTPARK